jgi:hypothetical protein
MLTSLDITTDPLFLAESERRLLGFEVLTKALSGNPNAPPQELLADKIGISSKQESKMLKAIRARLLSNGY